MKFIFCYMLWMFLWVWVMQYSNTLSQDAEIAEKTQKCYLAWWTEYLFWNWTCQKVIQERKTETILIK